MHWQNKVFLFTHATLPGYHYSQLFYLHFFIYKTRPEIIRNNAAFAVWLRLWRLFGSVSRHEFVTKLIMQKALPAVHLHHQTRPTFAKATVGKVRKI
jgi:hypothetical protein